MEHIQNMLKTHPMGSKDSSAIKLLTKTVLCSTTCYTCADACLAEDEPKKLESCIRLNLDCASICESTSQLLARPGSANHDFLYKLIEACKDVCLSCAEECEKHAQMHEHCRLCAQACRDCAQACEELMS